MDTIEQYGWDLDRQLGTNIFHYRNGRHRLEVSQYSKDFHVRLVDTQDDMVILDMVLAKHDLVSTLCICEDIISIERVWRSL